MDGEMRLNAWGRIARDCWREIPAHFPGTALDAFVVMPDHVHGVVAIRDADGTIVVGVEPTVGGTHASPLRRDRLHPGSLGAVVGSYKSAVSRRINAGRGTPGARVWQREYHDRIVRDAEALDAIRRYVADNPRDWKGDREF